jgi:hypothetical protein
MIYSQLLCTYPPLRVSCQGLRGCAKHVRGTRLPHPAGKKVVWNTNHTQVSAFSRSSFRKLSKDSVQLPTWCESECPIAGFCLVLVTHGEVGVSSLYFHFSHVPNKASRGNNFRPLRARSYCIRVGLRRSWITMLERVTNMTKEIDFRTPLLSRDRACSADFLQRTRNKNN